MEIGEINSEKLCMDNGYVLLRWIILKEYETSDTYVRIKNVGIYKVVSDDSAPDGKDYLDCTVMIHDDKVFQIQNYMHVAHRKDIIAIINIKE